MNASLAKIDSHTRSLIDPASARQLISVAGDAGITVLEELAISLEEKRPIVPPLRPHLTESGDDPSRYGWLTLGGKSYRPDDEISYDAIDDMMRSGQVVFALAIKQAAIRSVLRNERSWKINCEDEGIAEVVRGIMARMFRRSSHEFMTYIPYGSAFFEKEWSYEPGPYWGISGKEGKFYGPDLKAIHPRSINRIEYRDKGRVFDGFVQNRTNGGEIVVKPDNALILTHGKMWRNLWGTPALDIVYPYWFWLEVCMRAFMRYLERTGTPVTIVYAPMQGKITGSDGNEYDSMAYAMLQATYIAKSNAAAFPSDVDPETGQKLWDVSYLTDSNRGDQFVVAIERLSTMITRSLVIGDRTASQEGAVGSFAMSQVHYNVTQQHNEWLLDELLRQINDYVVKQLVLYNGTSSTPPALVETEGLDPEEKARLFNLLNTMGNQAGGEALKQIDWEAICAINNIPTLTQAQVDELYERELDRTKERNEALAATAGSQGAAPGGEKPEGPKKSVTQEPVKNSVEWLQYQLSQGAMVPAIISKDMAEQIADYGSARPFIISMQAEQEDDLEQIAQQILDELLAEEDEPVSEEEKQEALEAIKAYLEVKTVLELNGQTASLEYDEAVELSVGSFLKRVWGKIKSVAKRVVERRAAKRQAIRDKKTKEIQDAIRTKNGGVWREEDHPRDSEGKFAKKGTAGDSKDTAEAALPPGASVTPRKDFSKETVDEAISRMNIEEDLTESQMATLRLAVEKAKADPYLGSLIDFGKFQVLPANKVRHFGYYEPKKDKVFVSVEKLEEQMGDSWQWDENLEGIETREDAINAVFTEALLHEGAHSVLRNGKKLSTRTVSISLEESCTELIAWQAMDDLRFSTHPKAYKTSVDLTMHLMHKAYGDDKEAIFDAIYTYHQNGATADDMLDLVYRAYNIDMRDSREAKKKSQVYVPFGFLHQGYFEFLEHVNVPGNRSSWAEDGNVWANWLFGG